MVRGPALRTPDGRMRRGRVLALVLVIVLALAVLVTTIVVVRHRRHHHPARNVGANASTSATAPSSPAPSTSASRRTTPAATALPVGITFGGHLFSMSSSRLDRTLDDVVALHMTWIRVDLSWASLQPRSASSFTWSPMDRIVAAADQRHLQVLGLLSYTPSWARDPGCGSFVCPPHSAAAFARFAGAVVSRYAPRGVRTFQIWNEPNIGLFWSTPDAAAYRRLLDATVPAIRHAASGVRVLFGGLAYTGNVGGDIAPGRFLAQVCSDGRCAVDAVGYDPYTYPGLPSATAQPLNPWQLMANPSAGGSSLRAVMQRVGLGTRPIWVTGFGAPTEYPGGSDARLVSPARQSAILLDGLRLARSARSVVGGYFVDTLRDSADAGRRRDHFGIEDSGGARKPAFTALARALAS